MRQTKTRQERERELQVLIRTPEGRMQLEEIADRYQFDGSRARPEHSSIITYILVHEREIGLIVE